ncbi:MAG: Nre family DNA repair protein [Candidatus Thermoplasmatota archaeon]|nr:Nre family DNA repair protein [Candidatus Thermoplasmatota archaeon]
MLCRGTKMLCGRERCPVVARLYHQAKTAPLIDSTKIDGSSPPAVFIGRFGYPYVSVGPLVPPTHGDTMMYDIPELWLRAGVDIDQFIHFRSNLVRGKTLVNIFDLEKDRIVEDTRYMAMSTSPADVEAEFTKKPQGRLVIDDDVPPFGPSAPLKKLDPGNLKIDQRIDKAFSDTDLLAAEAVKGLYKDGTYVSKIQRAFSVGAFGLKKNRRFVPTRWSITAVDSMLGEHLKQDTKEAPLINEFRIYEQRSLDNTWLVVMLPTAWRYELVEAWYPQTAWNPHGTEVDICSSHEFFEGRKTYAEIGGCYYAARLAVNEALTKERRQAGVVILREALPGYILPVGVWNVRENVRAAVATAPHKFNTFNEVLDFVSKKTKVTVKQWIEHSAILHDYIYQRRIEDFA